VIEVRVQSLGLDKSSNTPVVILQELEGERVLPIWIGPGEASAIAMELAGMKFSRPLTHDLLASVISGLGAKLVRVLITKVMENTYYAELIIEREGELISVDARPSDSIAIALRMDARILTTDELLEQTAIDVQEAGDMSDEDAFAIESEGDPKESKQAGLRADELKEYLKRLDPEDFGRFNP
jgi:bifunctional DNase/RNase